MLGEREARTGNVYTATLTTRAQVEQQRRSRALAISFTPPPPGGFESSCLGDPEALFEGLPRHRISGIMTNLKEPSSWSASSTLASPDQGRSRR